MAETGELIDHLFRHQAGRMVSTLTRIVGPRHLQLAEDVVQEALVKALELWPHRGIPANPAAWLIEVARNRALDALRRETSLAAKTGELIRLAQGANTAECEAMDDQLAMIFLCCHPDVPREGRVALTLKTVCGFSREPPRGWERWPRSNTMRRSPTIIYCPLPRDVSTRSWASERPEAGFSELSPPRSNLRLDVRHGR